MSPVLVETVERARIVTLDRPERRNALDGDVLDGLRAALAEADADPDVDAVVLTGTDPAFCAGVDLGALSSGEPRLAAEVSGGSRRPWPVTAVPVIGAINGAAVTGGLELALACDLLVASDRAFFADTHARVGVMPCWQLTVRLPAAVGRRTATWMSLTGTPLRADQALAAGLVVDVVPHDDLLDTALTLARAVSTSDRAAAQALLHSYRQTEDRVHADGFLVESETSERWRAERHDIDDERRRAVLEHNRAAFSSGPGAGAGSAATGAGR